MDGEIELDESSFGGRRKGNRGRGAAGKIPVFGILERNGTVQVTVVPNVSAQTLIGLTVKTVRRGSIVYTDKFRSYDSLMFCGYRYLKINHGKRFTSGKIYINGLEGFWSWAMGKLKSQSTSQLRKYFPWLAKVYWNENIIWSPGYFVSSVGVDEETIKKYVEFQGRQDSGQLQLKLQLKL